MKFRTEITVPDPGWRFGHGEGIVCMGSCFANMIGGRLERYKFRSMVNPFGIVYHPVPLLRAMEAALKGEDPFTPGLFEREGRWRSFGLHSDLSHRDRGYLARIIRATLETSGAALRGVQVLVLTFGTAIAFRHRESGVLVANCHKVPQREFDREMTGFEELLEAAAGFLELLFRENEGLRVILTVSPVRHLRAGLTDNGASKAILRTLCHRLNRDHERVDYFPAFELLLDDLRDYRFYADDLAHPSSFAENYIWEKFAAAYIDEGSRERMGRLDGIIRDLAHRPSRPEGDAHRAFLQRLREKIMVLENELDLGQELAEVEERLGLR